MNNVVLHSFQGVLEPLFLHFFLIAIVLCIYENSLIFWSSLNVLPPLSSFLFRDCMLDLYGAQQSIGRQQTRCRRSDIRSEARFHRYWLSEVSKEEGIPAPEEYSKWCVGVLFHHSFDLSKGSDMKLRFDAWFENGGVRGVCDDSVASCMVGSPIRERKTFRDSPCKTKTNQHQPNPIHKQQTGNSNHTEASHIPIESFWFTQ